MPSNFIKILLGVTGLSPAILLLYIIKIKNDINKISFYINVSSAKEILKEINSIFKFHYLIFLCLIITLIAHYVVKLSEKNSAIGRIDVKSVKPADTNFTAVIFSIAPSFVKMYSPEVSDGILLAIILLIGVIFGYTMKSSYHFNLTLKLMGYNHYEVQTREEVTYLMLSKKQLINKKMISKYVKLADHMLLNVLDKM